MECDVRGKGVLLKQPELVCSVASAIAKPTRQQMDYESGTSQKPTLYLACLLCYVKEIVQGLKSKRKTVIRLKVMRKEIFLYVCCSFFLPTPSHLASSVTLLSFGWFAAQIVIL